MKPTNEEHIHLLSAADTKKTNHFHHLDMLFILRLLVPLEYFITWSYYLDATFFCLLFSVLCTLTLCLCEFNFRFIENDEKQFCSKSIFSIFNQLTPPARPSPITHYCTHIGDPSIRFNDDCNLGKIAGVHHPDTRRSPSKNNNFIQKRPTKPATMKETKNSERMRKNRTLSK